MHFLMHYHFPAAWAFELSHAYAVNATHANHDLYLGWMVEAWIQITLRNVFHDTFS